MWSEPLCTHAQMLIFLCLCQRVGLPLWKLGHLCVLLPATVAEATPRHTHEGGARRMLTPQGVGTGLHMDASWEGFLRASY